MTDNPFPACEEENLDEPQIASNIDEFCTILKKTEDVPCSPVHQENPFSTTQPSTQFAGTLQKATLTGGGLFESSETHEEEKKAEAAQDSKDDSNPWQISSLLQPF